MKVDKKRMHDVRPNNGSLSDIVIEKGPDEHKNSRQQVGGTTTNKLQKEDSVKGSSAGFKGGFHAKGAAATPNNRAPVYQKGAPDKQRYGPESRRADDFEYDLIESELSVIDMAKSEWEFTLYENSSIMVDLFQVSIGEGGMKLSMCI